jgi:hypothetical protein
MMMAMHAGLMSDGHGRAGKSRFEAAHSCGLRFNILEIIFLLFMAKFLRTTSLPDSWQRNTGMVE